MADADSAPPAGAPPEADAPPKEEPAPPHMSMRMAGLVSKAAAKFHRARPLMHSEPLLKFKADSDGKEVPYLDEQGLNMIRGIEGDIYPIVFLGDGRAGKSYLASRLLSTHEAFHSSDCADACTEGIDIAIAPRSKGSKDNIVVMDCEGGNNAMAAIRLLVNVFAVVASTEVVFVVPCMMSEAALDGLATALAFRQMLHLDEDGTISLPTRLTLVVNNTTLKYGDDALEKALNASADGSRAEVRSTIKATFQERRFVHVTNSNLPHFEEDISTYLEAVREGVTPLSLGGRNVNAAQMCLMLEHIRDEVSRSNCVRAPSIMRGVVFDGFLKPLSQRLLAGALPESLEDYDADLARQDSRPETLRKFDEESADLSQKQLVSEAREGLSQELDKKWSELEHQNELLGEQVASVTTESREVCVRKQQVPIEGPSLLKDLLCWRETLGHEARSVTHKKKGGDGTPTEWTPAGDPTERLLDGGLKANVERLPSVRGHLKLGVPGILEPVCAGRTPCYMVLTDLHIMWWHGPTSKDVEADECYCLLKWRELSLVQETGSTSSSAFVVKTSPDGVAFRFETESANAAWWADVFSKHRAVVQKCSASFPSPNLPPAPCLNALKERNMQDILRPIESGGCCGRLAAMLRGAPAEQPPGVQRPVQTEMMEPRQPFV